MMDVDDAVALLADAGLLTERQAEAWALRQRHSRAETADLMGVTKSTVDDRYGEARRKISQAHATTQAIEAVRTGEHPNQFHDFDREPSPDECDECGSTLAGPFARGADDQPLCLDCAGVEPETWGEQQPEADE